MVPVPLVEEATVRRALFGSAATAAIRVARLWACSARRLSTVASPPSPVAATSSTAAAATAGWRYQGGVIRRSSRLVTSGRGGT
jgi:hypothetical protein